MPSRCPHGAGARPAQRGAVPGRVRAAAPPPSALTAEQARVVDGPREQARVVDGAREEVGIAGAEHVPAVEAHILLPLFEPPALHQVPATHGTARRGPSAAARRGPARRPRRPQGRGDGEGGGRRGCAHQDSPGRRAVAKSGPSSARCSAGSGRARSPPAAAAAMSVRETRRGRRSERARARGRARAGRVGGTRPARARSVTGRAGSRAPWRRPPSCGGIVRAPGRCSPCRAERPHWGCRESPGSRSTHPRGDGPRPRGEFVVQRAPGPASLSPQIKTLVRALCFLPPLQQQQPCLPQTCSGWLLPAHCSGLRTLSHQESPP